MTRTDHRGMPGKTAFVYGTLMAPEVVQALIKRVPPMRPATLKGYTRHSVKGVVFPAIIPDSAEKAAVHGKVSGSVGRRLLGVQRKL